MIKFLKNQSPVRLIAGGFFLVILLGSFLLMLPISLTEGKELSYIDSLYTSVSAVCVTGLSTVEVHSASSPPAAMISHLRSFAIPTGYPVPPRYQLDVPSNNQKPLY